MKLIIGRTQIIGVFLAIVVIAAIVTVSLRLSQRLEDTSAWIRHTNLVIFQTQDLQAASLRYELSTKNFLLNGDSSLLDPLWRSAFALHTRIAGLRTLTSDNPRQQLRVDSLLQYVNSSMKLSDNSVMLRQSKGFPAAAALATSNEAKGYANRIRYIIAELQSEENGLMGLRRQTNQKAVSQLQEVLVGLIVTVAVLLLAIFFKISSGLSKEKMVKEQLSSFNKDLEEKIRIKTTGLQASEEKYRALFYKSPMAKWIYDLHTLQFLEVNEAAIQGYGYSQEEFLQMTIQDIRPPEDLDNLRLDVELAKSDPYESRHGYWQHIKKNGEIVFVEITAHPIKYDDHDARMIVVNDVTELKKSELLLKQLNEDLEKRARELAASNGELERFAYIASHDLQEPLRMVSSFVQLLQKKYQGKLDEKADQYIRFAIDGTERMKTLILDLLEYSRMGSATQNFEQLDTKTIVEEVATVFRSKIIDARARIDIESLPVLLADKLQLTQLFQNLIGNALKYHGPAPPVIRISAEEEPGQWKFAVWDNGIGIDPLFFEKIFIIFQRLHNKSDYSGTGIGLAICKKIVERHGGNIWVESELHKGSRFFFTIKTIDKPYQYERNSHPAGGRQ